MNVFDKSMARLLPIEGGYYQPVTESGCWIWMGAMLDSGYGRYAGKRAHRIFYEAHNGEIPEGALVCHRCDTRSCVNPNHLFIGTTDDSMADMVSKGRSAKRGGHGMAKLSEDEVATIRSLRGVMRGIDIALRVNVSKQLVSAIQLGRNWN